MTGMLITWSFNVSLMVIGDYSDIFMVDDHFTEVTAAALIANYVPNVAVLCFKVCFEIHIVLSE